VLDGVSHLREVSGGNFACGVRVVEGIGDSCDKTAHRTETLDREAVGMPIHYQRDDQRRLITITLTQPFVFDELLNQTNRQWAEDTWDYAVLYDTRASLLVSPEGEFEQMVERARIVGGGRPRGPVGVVIPPRPDIFLDALSLATRSGQGRGVEVLLNPAQLDAWIARHAPRRGASD
jgi:hypothetical protein